MLARTDTLMYGQGDSYIVSKKIFVYGKYNKSWLFITAMVSLN